METWRKHLIENIEATMWRQWAALGAYVTGEATRGSLVDPEALVVATFALGRFNARLFDEAMDWVYVNHRLLKPWRIKNIAREFQESTLRTLGAVVEYLSLYGDKELFPGIVDQAKSLLSQVKTEELFRLNGHHFHTSEKSADPVFLKWGFLRNQPRIREHSRQPDLENPANLMLWLRDYYGNGTRADVVTYLLSAGAGSAYEIASKIKYDRGGVYRALEDMVRAGTVNKDVGAESGNYLIDREKMARALGIKQERPVFFVWGDIYCAFDLVLSDRILRDETREGGFLSLERFRDLTAPVVNLLRNAGDPLSRLKVPDIKKQREQEHRDRLIQYLIEVTDILKSPDFI
jgi:hypothetical protein